MRTTILNQWVYDGVIITQLDLARALWDFVTLLWVCLNIIHGHEYGENNDKNPNIFSVISLETCSDDYPQLANKMVPGKYRHGNVFV